MRLGYSLGPIAGSGLTPAAHADLVRLAERLGYESVWSSEISATDPVAFLAWLAAQTVTVRLGSGVLQIAGRSALTAAVSAASMSQLTGGRFALGVGLSGPQMVEGWHGQPYDRPLARLRDYVTVLRMALAGDPVRYQGETLAVPIGEAPPPVLAPAASGHFRPVPLYLAGLGPKTVALAGELADGWIAIHCPPDYLTQARSWLEAGAQTAGRTLADFDAAVMVLTLVEEDEGLARDIMRPHVALYVGGMGTQQVNYYNRLARRLGFGAAATRVQSAYLAGSLDEAQEAVPDEMVDAMTLCGPAARVKERMEAYRAAGTGTLIVSLVAEGARMRREQMERITELMPGW
ncbi:MAG TPA: LLM class flavin-dependent oxidoreductase [Streptosporangiaceae bacterium]|nr:LLM class flavin-dependent oxidoreductase [Streptosporangiaceae bacterium]